MPDISDGFSAKLSTLMAIAVACVALVSSAATIGSEKEKVSNNVANISINTKAIAVVQDAQDDMRVDIASLAATVNQSSKDMEKRLDRFEEKLDRLLERANQ